MLSRILAAQTPLTLAGAPGGFLPWLLAIAGNRCRTLLAMRMRQPTMSSRSSGGARTSAWSSNPRTHVRNAARLTTGPE